jgi:prepilin-type N-terminal cleavage/methylation domain-containing protein
MTLDNRVSRLAFTLVELLVVIAILAVLMGLGGAAYFRWIGAKQYDVSEQTIRTVSKSLEAHMKSVRDQADKEDPPPSVWILAKDDPRRARVIWRKLRLRQEFPMTFAEARQPWVAPVTAQELPAKQEYVRILGSVAGGKPGESAACLLMALQRRRAGATPLTADDLGPAASDTDNDGLKELIDGWGQPLAFYRWPTGHPELEAANPHPLNVLAGKRADPLDPEGTLLAPAWFGPNLTAPTNERNWFQINLHPISPDGVRSYYTVPAVVSRGPDNLLGLAAGTMQVANGGEAADNIYSFKLRVGAARRE